MELRHLRYFVAVAEERHFTRAAARLGIRQPPLSAQIRQLERELGLPLFRRSPRGVALTEGGTMLLDEARRILEQVERTQASARSLVRGELGTIRLGAACGVYFQLLVPRIVRAYRERYPRIAVRPEQGVTARLLADVRAGELDVAFVRTPVTDPDDAIVTEQLVDEPMIVAVPAAHPLARRTAVKLTALAREPLVLFPRAYSPTLHDTIIQACRAAGFSPRLAGVAPQLPATVSMVAVGFGVAIVPESLGQLQVAGVAFVRLKGASPRAPVHLAYRRDQRSAAIANFVVLARERSRAPVTS